MPGKMTGQQRYDEQKRILRDVTISDREALERIRKIDARLKPEEINETDK